MTHPNFNTMNRAELRAYVLSHREDSDAWSAFVDLLHSQPPRAVVGAEESNERLTEVIRAIAKV